MLAFSFLPLSVIPQVVLLGNTPCSSSVTRLLTSRRIKEGLYEYHYDTEIALVNDQKKSIHSWIFYLFGGYWLLGVIIYSVTPETGVFMEQMRLLVNALSTFVGIVASAQHFSPSSLGLHLMYTFYALSYLPLALWIAVRFLAKEAKHVEIKVRGIPANKARLLSIGGFFFTALWLWATFTNFKTDPSTSMDRTLFTNAFLSAVQGSFVFVCASMFTFAFFVVWICKARLMFKAGR